MFNMAFVKLVKVDLAIKQAKKICLQGFRPARHKSAFFAT